MRTARLFAWLGLWLALAGLVRPAGAADDLAGRARMALRAALQEERGWTRIHAAEALLAVGDVAPVRSACGVPEAGEDARTERIGLWRVRAALAPTPAARSVWVEKIAALAVDPTAKDQLQAIESLAKLGVHPSPAILAAARRLAAVGAAESVYPLWLEHLGGEAEALTQIVARLDSPVPAARLRAAYVLRRLKPADLAVRRALARAAVAEPADSAAYPFVLGAAVLLDADPAQTADWRRRIEVLAVSGGASVRYEAAQILLQVRPPPAPALFQAGLDGTGDERIGAAWAILRLSAAH